MNTQKRLFKKMGFGFKLTGSFLKIFISAKANKKLENVVGKTEELESFVLESYGFSWKVLNPVGKCPIEATR